jgi:hypothetical protein
MNRIQIEEQAERLAEKLWREMAGQTMKEWMLLTGEMTSSPDWQTFRAKVFIKVEGRMNKWLPPVDLGPVQPYEAQPAPERPGRRSRT